MDFEYNAKARLDGLQDWKVSPLDESEVLCYAQATGVHPAVASSLMLRGITPEKLGRYFDSPLDNLSDPFRFPDMVKAVERIWDAVESGEKIFIHGDYDTDGVTSAVLFEWVLSSYGADVEIFVSNRMEDGYGPTASTVAKVRQRGCSLLISCDCGITSFEACEAARDSGMDVIITDHHNPARELPCAYAIVNPRMSTSLLDLHGLAGVGVVFKVCHAFVKTAVKRQRFRPEVDLRLGLDLVAMGTVADVSPMIGENRCLVRNGLKLMSRRIRPGLRSLIDSSHIEGRVQTVDISRRLAPKINAAGRVGDPMVSVRLLKSRDPSSARMLTQILDKFNRKRRDAEKKAWREVMAVARNQVRRFPASRGLLIVGNGWHPGVIGLLATKVSRKFERAVIILSADAESDELLGSGRSVSGINILSILDANAEMLASFGGHPMAVGVSLSRSVLGQFRRAYFRDLENQVNPRPSGGKVMYADAVLSLGDLTDEFFDTLEKMEPFGTGNQEPVYLFDDLMVRNVSRFGDRYCRGYVTDTSGSRHSFVSYNTGFDLFPRGRVHVLASPRRQRVMGRDLVQLHIVDVRGD